MTATNIESWASQRILYISLHPLNPFFAPLLIISCPSDEKHLKPAEREKENFHLKNKRATRLSKVLPRWVSTIPLIVFVTVLCHAWRLESQSSWTAYRRGTGTVTPIRGGGWGTPYKRRGRSSYILGIKKSVLLSLRVFSLKKTHSESFCSSFQDIELKKIDMTFCFRIGSLERWKNLKARPLNEILGALLKKFWGAPPSIL